MDAPGILVTVLGLLAGGAVSWLVIACQRAGIVGRRVAVLERDLAARRGTVARLAEVARAGWMGDAITVPVKRG